MSEVAAGKQSDVVTKLHQFLSQPGNHAFCSAIEPRRDCLCQRGDLSNSEWVRVHLDLATLILRGRLPLWFEFAQKFVEQKKVWVGRKKARGDDA